jgi:hypothetical protein
MEKKHYVKIEDFKKNTHYKEVAPCCGRCRFLFLENGKCYCVHPLLRNRMATTSMAYCGCYIESNFV